MKACKRIEIVIEAPLAETVIEVLKDIGCPAYTLISDIRGNGERGSRRADQLSGDSSNCLFIIACEDLETAQKISTAVRPLLTRSGGICLMSDASWLRH